MIDSQFIAKPNSQIIAKGMYRKTIKQIDGIKLLDPIILAVKFFN
jgi:hypothetical protein